MKHAGLLLLLVAGAFVSTFGAFVDYSDEDDYVNNDDEYDSDLSDELRHHNRRNRQHQEPERLHRRIHQATPTPFNEDNQERVVEDAHRNTNASRDPTTGGEPRPPEETPITDHLQEARLMAKLSFMDRIIKALGPEYVDNLPQPPSDTLATVPTPINITAEPCPYRYKRCSSETFFPSCDIPQNTDPETWAMRFNLYFDLSKDLEKLDIINATLRLYKNNSIPLVNPKNLLIKAHEYGRYVPKRRRSKKTLIATKSVPSDYIGWVSLHIEKTVKRWRKPRNNHGIQISVVDTDTIPWQAENIFVIMNCSSGLVPLPFEIQTDEKGQRYPALNVRQGSPADEFPQEQPEGTTETYLLQSDDPDVLDADHDMPQSSAQKQSPYPEAIQTYHSHSFNHSSHHHTSHSQAGNHKFSSPVQEEDSYEVGPARRVTIGQRHPHRNGHDHMAESMFNIANTSSQGMSHLDAPRGDYLITNQATNLHHGTHHSRNFGHSQQRHHSKSRYHNVHASIEDNVQSQYSEVQNLNGELREYVHTTEPTRSQRRGSGNNKERRHHSHHHTQAGRADRRNHSAAGAL